MGIGGYGTIPAVTVRVVASPEFFFRAAARRVVQPLPQIHLPNSMERDLPNSMERDLPKSMERDLPNSMERDLPKSKPSLTEVASLGTD